MPRRKALHHHRPAVGPASRLLSCYPSHNRPPLPPDADWRGATLALPELRGVFFFGAGLRLCPTREVAPLLPRHGAPQGSPLLVQGRRCVVVACKIQCENGGGWGIPGPNFGRSGADQAPSFPGALHDPAGAVRGFWCLQVHVASTFSRRVQLNVGDSRGVAVSS